MKELLKLSNISCEVMGMNILEDVTAHVQKGDIIGVIGKNGAGKSTLMQLINQDIVPVKGQIQWFEQDLKVVLVAQEMELFSFENKTPLEAKLREKWQVPTQDYSQLSGGEKLKARLAAGFSTEADLLLLDEPTNHLDEQSIAFLISQIKNDQGTIILVSHDRYFLDEVTTKIWSIEDKKVFEQKGNYSSYVEIRKKNRLARQREYEKQQKMIDRIGNQMKELTSWSKQAHAQSTKKEGFKEYYRLKAKRMDAQVKSKQKRLEKELEKAQVKPVEPEYTVQFSIHANNKVGRRFIEVKNLTKFFAGRTLFQNVNFTIQHGEKVAIIGPNGSGKTTLLRVILGQETAEGDIWMSPSAKIGYLTQEVFDLPLEQTMEQFFYQETFAARGKVQSLMKHLGFLTSSWNEPMKHLSMGERVKCKLMKYIIDEKDVLILDEPTNHLDLPSREQLEKTLGQYHGTLIIVSHDRYFVEKTTHMKLILENKGIKKQLNELPTKKENLDELRLILETERQEVLGKLSFMTPKDKEYAELDRKFKALTKQIKDLF